MSRHARREACVHEAGHAVVYALGSILVHRVAVAPEGATAWSTTGRKGHALADLWGVCEPAGILGGIYLRWDAADCTMTADRAAFAAVLRIGREHSKALRRESYRQVRAHVCGALSGPVAEAMFKGEAPGLTEGEWGPGDDFSRAEVLCWLLPRRAEREHLAALTLQTLRDPAVWALVLRLAEALEQAGDMQDLVDHLPAPLPHWPPSALSAAMAAKRTPWATGAPAWTRATAALSTAASHRTQEGA